MALFLVSDLSEAMELCASQQLYLKPVSRLSISISLPYSNTSTEVVSVCEAIEKLKNLVFPDRFISIVLIMKARSFLMFEGEVASNYLKQKLNGQTIKLSAFEEDLLVTASKSLYDFLTPQELEASLITRKSPKEDLAKQAKDSPGCIHLEGLPCKWFAVKGSVGDSPSKDVLRTVFEKFGKTKNVDITMPERCREEVVGETMDKITLCGLQTFEAFVQFKEITSFSNVIETFRTMMLMFKREDGMTVATKIKVTPDTTDHFGKSAVNEKKPEYSRLQGLERNQKGESKTERLFSNEDIKCRPSGLGISNCRERPNDEEEKTGERTRESKVKTDEVRQADHCLKHPRKCQVSDAEDLWQEKMPIQEEKKCSIPQKRMESLRLLSLLLNKVKDVALASGQVGHPLRGLENKRKVCSSTSQIHNAPKERVNCLGQQVGKFKSTFKYRLSHLAYPVAKKKELYILGAPIERNVLSSPISFHDIHKITAAQNSGFLMPPYQGDCYERNVSYYPISPRAEKEKIYETDEFIHYLFNYYHPPPYERVIPGLHDPVGISGWQRVVHFKEKSEDVPSVKDLSGIPNTQEESSRSSHHLEERDERPEVLPKSHVCFRGFVRSSLVHCKDLSDLDKEAGHHSKLNSPASATSDRKSQAEDTEMMAVSSHKPVNKLKGVVQEVSRKLERFSDLQSKKEVKNGGSYGVRDLSISVENVPYDDGAFEFLKRKFSSDLWPLTDEERKAGGKRRRMFKEPEPPAKMQRKYSRTSQYTMPGAMKAKHVTHMDGCPFKEPQRKAGKGNVDVHKTSENGCKIGERRRACKDGTGRGVLRPARDV